MIQAVTDYLEAHRQEHLDELLEFLRIPSISADSTKAGSVREAAHFVANKLRAAKLATEVIETEGHPLVYAEWLQAPGAPTILIYGHYDVQPPDPLNLWISPPFEPTLRDGNIYARGATDDKGQMYTHVKAVEAWMNVVGKLPVNVKFLIEGEEEVGSEAITRYLATAKQKLACDAVVISDTCMFAPDTPAITYGLKGIAYFEVIARGPKRDLHSGTFGGSVQNPINALCTMIAALKDDNGRIQLPGFYDDVEEMTDLERQKMQAMPFSEEAYRAELGVPELFGEAGRTTLERRWVRPTCDVNGIYGGYQGEGTKTVLPAFGGVKVSFRLVPHQDPRKIEASFEQFIHQLKPPGITLEIIKYHSAPGVVTPIDGPAIAAAARALEAAYGRAPLFIREGGSIPIVGTFKQELGADSILIGFGLSDDNTHSPNEKFCLNDYYRGIKTSAHLLAELAR